MLAQNVYSVMYRNYVHRYVSRCTCFNTCVGIGGLKERRNLTDTGVL